MLRPAAAEKDLLERENTGKSGGAIARNAAHLIAGQVVTTVLAVLLSAALGRSLGATDFGLFFLVTSMAQFAFVVVEWGQLQYVVREVARAPGRSGLLLGSTLVLRIAGTVLLTLLTVLTAWAFGYDLRTRGLAAMLMAGMLPYVLAQAIALIFRGRERMDYESIVSMVNKAGTLSLTLIALGMGMGLPGAFLAQGVAGLIALTAATFFLRRLLLPTLRVSWGGVREIATGGAPLVVMSVAVASQSYIEALVLSKLGSPESIGWFGAAKVILGTLIAPATILATSVYPRLSRAADDPQAFRSELQLALRPLVGLAVLAAVGTYLFAGGAVRLIYGEGSFGPTARVLQAYAPGLLLLFLDVLLGGAVLAAGRPLPLAVAKLVTVATSTALAWLLVPLSQEHLGNGGLGIALAFCICELIMFLTAIRLLPRGTIQPGTVLDAGRALLAGVAVLIVFLFLPPLPMMAGAPLCTVVFLGLSATTGLVRRSELIWFWSKLRRRGAPGS